MKLSRAQKHLLEAEIEALKKHLHDEKKGVDITDTAIENKADEKSLCPTSECGASAVLAKNTF